MPSLNKSTIGILQILLSACAYGSMPVIAKLAYSDGVSMSTLLFLRFLIATALLLPWTISRGYPWPRGKVLLILILMGAIGFGGVSACYFLALNYASTGTVVLLVYLYPILVLGLSTFFFREPITPLRIGAMLLAVLGLGVTVGSSLSSSGLGLLLSLSAAVMYAFYILIGSHYAKGVHPLTASSIVISTAAVSYGLSLLVNGYHGPASIKGWSACLLLAVFCTIFAMSIFLAGLGKIGATKTSLTSTAEPIVANLLGWLFLGEVLSTAKILGGLLILGAVALISREAREEETVLTDLHE